MSAFKKLAQKAEVPEDDAKLWLIKEAIRQIYLFVPTHIPGPTFDVHSPNAVD